MADPITAGFAAAVSGAAAIFSYNKEAFVFERTLRQAEAHQRQNMRVQEVALYREDIRDLFGVTIQKMDNYLIVNTLMIGFCISLLYAIELPSWCPDWIYWMWTLSISGAMLFLLLSIWLCLHASITAQSLVVRLLTQWLRLPVPNAKEIGKYVAQFQDYEKNANFMMRLPMLGKTKPTPASTPAAPSHSGSHQSDHIPTHPLGHGPSGDVMQGIEDLSGHQLQKTHLHLFRELARSWRGYDAYARVCMIMGTNQLLQALGHLSIAKTFLMHQQPFASLFVVITMHSLSLIHFKLNITPTREQHTMMTVLLGVPPVTAFVAASLWYYSFSTPANIVAIVAIFVHLIWICFVLTLAMEDDGGMPKNFTQVGLSSDIVGDDTFQDYIDDELERIRQRDPPHEEATEGDAGNAPLMTIAPMVGRMVSAPAGDVGTGPNTTQVGGDASLAMVKQRLKKIVRQWNNVTGGTLALTPQEKIVRKRKIVQRFERLCRYVKNMALTGDTAVDTELSVIMDVKWNRVNDSVYIHNDTGEIRTPPEMAGGAVTGVIGKTVEQIKRFRDADVGVEYREGSPGESSRSSDDVEEDNPLMTVMPLASSASTRGKDTVVTISEGDEDSERTSLIFGDSKKTSQMLKKASTRPWASYKQGSGLLIICWLIALIMSVLLAFGISPRNPTFVAYTQSFRTDLGGAVDAGVASSHHSIKLR